jgi:hypothetical protein
MMDLEVAGVIVVVVYWIIRREFIYLLTDLFIYLLFNQWGYNSSGCIALNIWWFWKEVVAA